MSFIAFDGAGDAQDGVSLWRVTVHRDEASPVDDVAADVLPRQIHEKVGSVIFLELVYTLCATWKEREMCRREVFVLRNVIPGYLLLSLWGM